MTALKSLFAASFLIVSPLAVASVSGDDITRIDMRKKLKSLTTEDSAVEIRVRANFPAQNDNACATTSLEDSILTVTLMKPLAQGEYCSIKIVDGNQSAVVRFHASTSDN